MSEPTAVNQAILLGLDEAAVKLRFSPKQLERLARLRDIAHVELDGQLYFRPEALLEWACRNEQKVW
jgi:hypothetical protein